MPLNHKRRFQSMAIKSCHFPDTSVVFRCNRNDTVALHSPAENYIPGFYRFRLCLAGSFLPWDNQLAALDIDSSERGFHTHRGRKHHYALKFKTLTVIPTFCLNLISLKWRKSMNPRKQVFISCLRDMRLDSNVQKGAGREHLTQHSLTWLLLSLL